MFPTEESFVVFFNSTSSGYRGHVNGIDGNNNNIVNDDDLFQKSQF